MCNIYIRRILASIFHFFILIIFILFLEITIFDKGDISSLLDTIIITLLINIPYFIYLFFCTDKYTKKTFDFFKWLKNPTLELIPILFSIIIILLFLSFSMPLLSYVNNWDKSISGSFITFILFAGLVGIPYYNITRISKVENKEIESLKVEKKINILKKKASSPKAIIKKVLLWTTVLLLILTVFRTLAKNFEENFLVFYLLFVSSSLYFIIPKNKIKKETKTLYIIILILLPFWTLIFLPATLFTIFTLEDLIVAKSFHMVGIGIVYYLLLAVQANNNSETSEQRIGINILLVVLYFYILSILTTDSFLLLNQEPVRFRYVVYGFYYITPYLFLLYYLKNFQINENIVTEQILEPEVKEVTKKIKKKPKKTEKQPKKIEKQTFKVIKENSKNEENIIEIKKDELLVTECRECGASCIVQKENTFYCDYCKSVLYIRVSEIK